MSKAVLRIQELSEALREIVDPISRMRAEADRQGDKLNGAMAVRLADDANYLKGIAVKALSGARADQDDNDYLYLSEQIFFHILIKGGDGNPFRAISSQWFVDLIFTI